jgi:hypothetical protein
MEIAPADDDVQEELDPDVRANEHHGRDRPEKTADRRD